MCELANVISISIHGTEPTFDDDDDYDKENQSQNVQLPATELDATESISIGSLPLESLGVEPLGVEPLGVETGDVDKVYEIVEFVVNDKGDLVGGSVGNAVIDDNNLPSTSTSTSTKSDWSKYTPSMLRKPISSQLKRPASVASTHSDKEDSLQCLKKRLIVRELEMREIEHKARMSQQQAEHEARMALLESQKMDIETKIELRQMKIGKLAKEPNSDTDSD